MNTTHTSMIAEIKAHLAAGGRVAIHTATRVTVYTAKHADLFVREDAGGVYIRHGKRTVYAFAYQVRLHA